jgi:thiamine monophosphate synthase
VWVTGGVDPTAVVDMVAAGARHFVVVRWLTEAPDPAGATRVLRRTIDQLVGRSGG